jgi:hypothetical protein
MLMPTLVVGAVLNLLRGVRAARRPVAKRKGRCDPAAEPSPDRATGSRPALPGAAARDASAVDRHGHAPPTPLALEDAAQGGRVDVVSTTAMTVVFQVLSGTPQPGVGVGELEPAGLAQCAGRLDAVIGHEGMEGVHPALDQREAGERQRSSRARSRTTATFMRSATTPTSWPFSSSSAPGSPIQLTRPAGRRSTCDATEGPVADRLGGVDTRRHEARR